MLGNVLLAIPDWLFNQLQFGDDALAILGGIMVGIGIAGHRAGWGPRCRKCGFDLRGVVEGAPACPECGSSLKSRRAVKFGVRARRWGMVVAGVLVLTVATASNVLQWPSDIAGWRERVIAESFDLEKLIDLALEGSTRASAELQGILSGTNRRFSGRLIAPGQDALVALLDRMERDPTTRATLLPILFSTSSQASMMWSRGESALPVRIAALLTEVAEQDPALLDKIGGQGPSSLFQGGRPTAVAQLLSSPKMVAYLYRGGGSPEMRISDGPVSISLGASFGSGSAPLWMHNLPLVLQISDARWRIQGEPESAWRDVKRIETAGMTGSANVTIDSPPESGVIEVRVRGNVVQGPEPAVWRQAIGHDLREPSPYGSAGAEAIAAARTLTPFEWNRTITLKPRAQVVLKPLPARNLGKWLEDLVSRTTVIKDPTGTDGRLLLLSEVQGSLNNAFVVLTWNLEQDGHAWEASERRSIDGQTTAFNAPDFDTSKPFTVTARPDIKRLRLQAAADTVYLDLNRALLFDALGRPPREVRDLPTAAPD